MEIENKCSICGCSTIHNEEKHKQFEQSDVWINHLKNIEEDKTQPKKERKN